MRIAHVVTYISADGAFGGPVSVALGQTEALARRGHRVELLAGWDGRATLPAAAAERHLFPVRRIGPGFGGLIAPGLSAHLARTEYDVVHVHVARDLITLSAASSALRAGARLVVQPHGMIMPDRRLRARLVDSRATREVLRSAAAVLHLTDAEAAGLTTVVGATLPTLQAIPNGIAVAAEPAAVEQAEPPVVMFLARLHPRKRVLAFAEAARLLIQQGSTARFEILGPDEGDLRPLQNYLTEHGLGDRVVYRGAIPQGSATRELRRASVYVLPAEREVFPMTVLEALAVGTPVVLGVDCGIAPELARRGAATVTDSSPSAVARAVERLLVPGPRRAEQIARGTQSVCDWFSIEAVAARLEEVYHGHRIGPPGDT